MGGLRSKFLVALIIYFAGFATSIYLQAPALDNTGVVQTQNSNFEEIQQESRAEDITKRFKSKLFEYLSIAEEKASKAGESFQARLDE